MRIGHAWDTHKLVSGRRLILGGVEIESEIGLLGHSDADVVLHAVAESLLGSLALGDLGTYWSDKDPRYEGMDSSIILKRCHEMILERGYEISNIDLTIYSEIVKISPVRDKIRESIANMLNTDVSNISVKATTWEKMGFVGRGEAIACECVCLVDKIKGGKVLL